MVFDLYRICPSKLNKRELEDLYFALLENNLELKKTINGQNEKIKTLTAKVQRLSAAQKGSFGRESRECCLTTKAKVNEQKEMITELRKANERMSERIRLLNMRLCSAKQFVKRSPVQSTTRCSKCNSNAPANSTKNTSSVALNTDLSDSNLKTVAVSCHCVLDKDVPTTRSVLTETEEEPEKEYVEKTCDENKCRTLMEELKQKIVNLQEELASTHTEYSSRIGRLETEVSSLQARDKHNQNIASRLSRAEIQNGELAMELSIEKGKVAELETNMKAAQMSSKVAETIDGHLANIKSQTAQSVQTKEPNALDAKTDVVDVNKAINADDSGYAETTKSTELPEDKALVKHNQELMSKILELQTQLDQYKVSAANDTADIGTKTHPLIKIDEVPKHIKASLDQVSDDSEAGENEKAKEKPQNYGVDASTTLTPSKFPVLWINNGQKTSDDIDERSIIMRPNDKPVQLEKQASTVTFQEEVNTYQIPASIASETSKYGTKKNLSKTRFSSKESAENKHDINEKTTKTFDDSQVNGGTSKQLSIDDELSQEYTDEEEEEKELKREFTKDSLVVAKVRLHKQKSNTNEDKDLSSIDEDDSESDEKVQPMNKYDEDPKPNEVVSTDRRSSGTDKKEGELGTQTGMDLNPKKPLLEPTQTYTVNIEGTHSQATDTEHEISAMTDLSTEREDKSVRERSPGEDKATSTCSYSAPTTDYGTLSEGELPAKGKARTYSVGERPPNNATPVLNRMTSHEKMEETLHAITEELARCKELLLSRNQQKRDRPQSVDVDVMADLSPAPIALKTAPGCQRIGDAVTPKCIFTLHIGTVVLSDEAVVNSHNMSLMLTWRFYDQNLAMTRMRAGRVVLFDFSTEYDVKMTDDFLNYMKYEEMPIVICELNSPEEPFVSCSLPLRNALLHTNRRADMSLALVAGPQLRSSRGATDTFDSGDEVGVLDLWCMLKVEPRLSSAISRAIAKPTPLTEKSNSNLHSRSACSRSRHMEHIMEDDQSNERLSQDLDLNVEERHQHNHNHNTSQSQTTGPKLLEIPEDGDSQTPAYDYFDVNKYPVVHRKSTQKQRVSEQSDPDNMDVATLNTDEFCPLHPRRMTAIDIIQDATFKTPSQQQDLPSGVIINEVPANIRCTEEMKEALERNAQLNPMYAGQIHEKYDDQRVPSSASIRSLRTQRYKRMLSTISMKQHKKDHEGEPAKKNSAKYSNRFSFCKEKKVKDEVSRKKKISEEDSDPENDRKYDNISKILERNKRSSWKPLHYLLPSGSSRDVSKRVTINNEYHETPTKDTRHGSSVQADEYGTERDVVSEDTNHQQTIEITVLWLSLNEECEAVANPRVKQVFVAYSFLGRNGADLETPFSLPKPKNPSDKCYFNFRKKFQLQDHDLPLLGHMAKCRSTNTTIPSSKDCIIFSVVSEPPEDPLGLENCEDIGEARVYLGDILKSSAGKTEYTAIVPVVGGATTCGALAVRFHGLDVVRRCLALNQSQWDLSIKS